MLTTQNPTAVKTCSTHGAMASTSSPSSTAKMTTATTVTLTTIFMTGRDLLMNPCTLRFCVAGAEERRTRDSGGLLLVRPVFGGVWWWAAE